MSADLSCQGPATRGHLRIYLGCAPGAGTTCALLSEGRQRAEHGTDVVVASVETQGRPGTEALLADLEVISPPTVANRGMTAEGIDLGAILARSPEVALVDDLAQSNAPGARYATRWQDVEDLLAAGIDVISTVRIAHLESLSDVVAKIARAAPQQTVPDPVVRVADEVQLVDIAPEVLRDRMACGQIYPPRQAEAALGSWCQAGNLAALRELALLWLAATLANGPQRHRPGSHDLGFGQAQERVVVALSDGPEGEALIRRAARIAARSGADLLAVHAASAGGPAATVCAALADQRRLTESLGGSYHQLADDDIPTALLAFVRTENATRLMIGAGRRTRLLSLPLWPGTAQRVIRGGSGIALHVVSRTPTANGVSPWLVDQIRENQLEKETMVKQEASWPGCARLAGRWGRKRPALAEASLPGRVRWLASAAVVAVALMIAGCGSSSTGSGGAATSSGGATGVAPSRSALATTTINGVTVLTNAKGFTLYSFAPDTPTTSRCNGQCAQFWPPLKGPVTAGSGVPGTLGTITRSDGSTQATYNGHPLYTYVADTAPGQAKGNDLNVSGGVWHEATASSGAAPSPSSGGSGSSEGPG